MIFLIIGRIVFFGVYVFQMVSLAMYLRSVYHDPDMAHLVWAQVPGLLTWLGFAFYSCCFGERQFKRMWIVWALYTIGFVTPVGAIFSQDVGKLDKSKFFGPNVLKATLCLAPALLVLLISTTLSAKKNPKLVERLSITIAVDLFDGIEMLEVLIYQGKELEISKSIMVAILFFASLCFLVSSMALCEFKFIRHYNKVKNRRYTTLLRAGIQSASVNLPFLILRGIIWDKYSFSAPIFITKNVLSIASCIIDIIFVCNTDDTSEEFVI